MVDDAPRVRSSTNSHLLESLNGLKTRQACARDASASLADLVFRPESLKYAGVLMRLSDARAF